MSTIRTYRDLDVYQNAMNQAMRVFELTKTFPAEEKFSLTDQVRRCTRSVCANIAEAWRKRRYAAAFVAKLNDAEGEAAEAQVHLEIAVRASYLKRETFAELDDAYDKILGHLVRMIDQPDKWLIKPNPSSR